MRPWISTAVLCSKNPALVAAQHSSAAVWLSVSSSCVDECVVLGTGMLVRKLRRTSNILKKRWIGAGLWAPAVVHFVDVAANANPRRIQ